MKSVELLYSKNQVDKAGEELKKNKELAGSERYLDVLSNWRSFHAMPLDTFAKVLRTRVDKVKHTNSAIVAQRLKRTSSILLKLKTHKTMRLSAMQDIGGLRAILESVSEVNELIELYRKSKTRHILFGLNDYIEKPKVDGYRCVHLVYKVKKTPNIFIEIQVRSNLQHIWATGVEVFGTLKNSSFKSGHGEKKWLDFFSILSSVFALKEKTPLLEQHKGFSTNQILELTKKMINELKVVEQLSVYTAFYKINTSQVSQGRKGNYSLILLNSHNNTISINTYSSNQIEKATKDYLKMEKEYFNDIEMNVVLVNTGDIKKLEASYPNYFMDTKLLVRYLSEIVLDKFI